MEAAVNPALQAILDSLNQSSNRSSTSSTIDSEPAENHPSIPGPNFLPDAGPPASSASPNLQNPAALQSKVVDTNLRNALSVPDASNITTWPAALKHVTRYIASNAGIANKIRQLIKDQHNHEKQWWAGREIIVRKHQSRMGNQQQAADLLRSLGGIPTTLRPINESSEKAELEAYDKKVYSELIKMTAEYDRRLRAMSIPFYAIKHELVILERGATNGSIASRIDRGELMELQKKMLQLLEDLFSEDN